MGFTIFGVSVEEKWASKSMECRWKRSRFHNVWSVGRREVNFTKYEMSMKEK